MNENEMENTIVFHYNKDNNAIITTSKSNLWVGLKGGVWKKTGYRFPLNKMNIDLLFKNYKHGVSYGVVTCFWRLSLVEAMAKFLKDEIGLAGSMRFLHTLTLDKIDKYPIVYKSPNTELQPFSNQKVSQYWQQYVKHHAMLWEMGTGKTRGVVEAFEIKKKKGLVKRCLVVCPVSMLDKWVEEIEKWSGNTNAVALKGSKADKLELLSYDFDWFVTNFETLPIVMEKLEKIVNNKWFVILDEFTKIKNPFAKRTKTCVKLGKLTDHKTILSGTPITQNAYDIFAPFMFLDNGETFGLNYENFIDKYFWRNGYRKVAMNGSLEQISEKIFDSSTRFRKKECIDIPDKIYDTRILELPAYNKDKYDEMVKYAITQLMDSEAVTAPIILVQLLRLSQITSGFVVDEMNRIVDFKEQPKLDAFQDILDSSNGSKIIVWSRFKHDVDKLYEQCNKSGVKAVKLYSDTKQDARTRNIKAFQEDKTTKVILGTAGTGGHGIDLVAGSIVVYYSNSYSLEQRLQSEDRAHRAGQKNQVTYIDLLCKGTVDIAIYKILRAKKSIADVVTRDNIFEMLSA